MKELVLISAIAIAVSAQTPAFEVASIKPNRAGGGISSIRVTPGRVTMENVSLKKVTLWAYGIPDDREYALVGADWLTTEHFDFQASFPPDTSPEQIRAMTQALLAERFKLALPRKSDNYRSTPWWSRRTDRKFTLWKTASRGLRERRDDSRRPRSP